MSNQTPDRSHASGTFVPEVAPPFTGPVLNSKAISTFVRNSSGNYTIGLSNQDRPRRRGFRQLRVVSFGAVAPSARSTSRHRPGRSW